MRPLAVLLALVAALFLPAVAAAQFPGHATLEPPVVSVAVAFEVIATPAAEALQPIAAAALEVRRRRPVVRVVTWPARFLIRHRPGLIVPRRL